jgi:cytochrome bd-type quinol oxidase subunit 2
MESEQRLLFRQGALFLLLSAAMGIVVAAQVPHPAKWMVAHLSGLMTGLVLIAQGAVWPAVRLSDSTRRRAVQLGLTAAWFGLVANIYSAIVNLPGPGTEPDRQPDAMWQMYVLFVMLAVIVPTTLVSFFLVWRGLRG